MNKEIKTLWVKALRSGKYKQGRGALRNTNNEFCCLGVLCDVARKEGVIGRPKKMKDEGLYAYGPIGNSGVLPTVVKEWAGLTGVNPYIGPEAASNWNDAEKKSFDEIADLIEEYL